MNPKATRGVAIITFELCQRDFVNFCDMIKQ